MSDRIDGDEYRASDAEREHFATCGFVHLRGLLSDVEVAERGDAMSIDDQLLAKQPFEVDAGHQDMAYWPDGESR